MITITILEKDDCSFCDLAKDIVRRVSAEFPVTLETMPFESPRGVAMVREHGAVFPPVVLVDGEFFCYGRMSERRLRKELARRYTGREA